jgi:hypothetical protein
VAGEHDPLMRSEGLDMSVHDCEAQRCDRESGLHANDDFVSLPAEIDQAVSTALAELTAPATLTEIQTRAAVAELLAELRWRRQQAERVQAYLDGGKGRRLGTTLAQLPAPTPAWGITTPTPAAPTAQ